MMPRLVLFDIDGTLLKPCGLGRRSLERTFHERFGREGVFDLIRFHGRMDPEIVRLGLEACGQGPEEGPELLAAYIGHLRAEVAGSAPLLLPGVREVLADLTRREDVLVGLVTGNTAEGAAIKLGRDGVRGLFKVGAFGDESVDRAELVALARGRAEEFLGRALDPASCCHVGDTVADVDAARRSGIRAVAVATGGDSADVLAASEPDVLLDSMHPATRFLDAVLS